MRNIAQHALRTILLVATAATLVGHCCPGVAAEQKSQKYALLVGINSYAKPLGDLAFSRNDVQELQKTLRSAGFADENTVLLCDGASDSRYLPSKANILKELELLLAMAEEGDSVLVAFSGHGLHVDGASYFCPFDAKIEKAAQTMVALDDLYERLQTCKASQKVLLVDACRNEPLTKGFRAPGGMKGFADDMKQPPKGVWLLTSCGPGQWSAEDPTIEHGVFMYYVLEGLRGRADQECAGNRDGSVTLDEWFHYANQKTMNHVRRSHGIVQKPLREGRADGDYVVASVSSIVDDPVRDRPLPKPSASTAPAEGAAPAKRTDKATHPLLTQADAYLRQVDYANAIAAYSALIDDSSLPVELRHKARRGRSAAYIGRGEQADLDKAIVDQQATGAPGLQLTVRTQSAPLQIGTEVKNTVIRNQVVLITITEKEWLWVESVNGDATIQGYLSRDAVIEAREEAAATETVDSTPTTSSNTQERRSLSSSYQQRTQKGRPPSIWQTPEWETPREIREKRARGEVR